MGIFAAYVLLGVMICAKDAAPTPANCVAIDVAPHERTVVLGNESCLNLGRALAVDLIPSLRSDDEYTTLVFCARTETRDA